MLKDLTFNLKGPICECPAQNLKWWLNVGDDKYVELGLGCDTCQRKVIIPYKQLQAKFLLDRAYPKGIKPDEPTKQEVPPPIKHSQEMTAEDRKFLKSLNISPDDPQPDSTDK